MYTRRLNTYCYPLIIIIMFFVFFYTISGVYISGNKILALHCKTN